MKKSTTTKKEIKRGEWKAVEEYDGWAVIETEPQPTIGKLYVAREINQGKDGGEADAKLIAAAPELLKMLSSFVNLIKPEKDFAVFFPIKEAEALIKKATK